MSNELAVPTSIPRTMAFMDQRKAEMELGRRRAEELVSQFRERDPSPADSDRLKVVIDAGKQQIKDDEETLKKAADNYDEGLAAKRERDRAAAEVIDQAQTLLEGVMHGADRKEKITTYEQQWAAESLDVPKEVVSEAHKGAIDIATAQAVNQPTVQANDEGQDTHKFPLNRTGFEQDKLAHMLVPLDKHVPKDQKQARRKAKESVPKPKEINGPDPDHERAVKIVRKADDDVLGE